MWPHPRAGGENKLLPAFFADVRGSSPRWRGKLRRSRRRRGVFGLIPALAGKTQAYSGTSNDDPAHPRAGGENKIASSYSTRASGSSPRWRGKRREGLSPDRIVRLIPALAGKTRLWAFRPKRREAHPRAGGENSRAVASASRAPGSSPRWRGKPWIVVKGTVREGLIPALAGKTRKPVRGAQDS